MGYIPWGHRVVHDLPTKQQQRVVTWVLVAALGTFVGANGAFPYSVRAFLGLWHSSSRVSRLRSCGAWTWPPCSMRDLSFLTRDRTCVPCIRRWILNHWTNRESLNSFLFKYTFSIFFLLFCFSKHICARLFTVVS